MTTRHPFKTSARSGCATVTELPDRVRIVLEFDRYGDCGDEAEVRAALLLIVRQYETDPRPIEMPNPHSGETALVNGVGGVGIAVITPPRRH